MKQVGCALTIAPLTVLKGADAAAVEAYATLDNVRQAMGFAAGRRR